MTTPDPLAGLTGPPELIERIRQRLATQQTIAESAPTPASDAGKRPNVRHTAVNELLDMLETAVARGSRDVSITDETGEVVRVTITRAEEERLRTYGRSGPAVTTLVDVVALVMQWREWELQTALRRG